LFSDRNSLTQRGNTNMGTISITTDTFFTPLTVATAPEASRPMMEKVQKSLGFIPNLLAIFATNPTVLEGYLALGAVFEKGSFTPREQQIILLAASVENNCNYCATAHSQIAKALRTPAEVIAAVQNEMPVPDAKLNALVTLVRELVRERGYAKEKSIQKFLAAGYKKNQVMELLLGIALKTISNYLDHISPTPLDHLVAGESK
jgi:uncharacterized peroxidase-related enzyme